MAGNASIIDAKGTVKPMKLERRASREPTANSPAECVNAFGNLCRFSCRLRLGSQPAAQDVQKRIAFEIALGGAIVDFAVAVRIGLANQAQRALGALHLLLKLARPLGAENDVILMPGDRSNAQHRRRHLNLRELKVDFRSARQLAVSAHQVVLDLPERFEI